MKSRTRKTGAALAAATLCAGVIATAPAAAQTWSATEIVTPTSPYEIRGLNAGGQVIGSYRSAGGDPVGFYTGAGGIGLTTIGSLGGAGTRPWDINDAGTIVGQSQNAAGVYQGFVVQPGGSTPTHLVLSSDPTRQAGASAVNESGVVAGYVLSGPVLGTVLTSTSGSPATPVSAIGAGGPSGINASGQVAGSTYVGSGCAKCTSFLTAFYTGPDATGVTVLGTLGGFSSSASAINDAGQVVGHAAYVPNEINSPVHAFIAGTGTTGLRDLGTLGGASSSANDVNGFGQAVGWAQLADGSRHAFITGGDGLGLFDLNDLVSFSDGTVLTEALGISSTGYVVALGSNALGQKAYLLKNPVPEPSTYVLMGLGLGLAAAGAIARRRSQARAAPASSRA